MLGAISLDLFAVLFGGAIALLPLFAQQILHTGPVGLGVLRSAPAVGALLAGVMLARRPLARPHRARRSSSSSRAFGVCDDRLRALASRSPLSLAALAVSGFVDMISVNIRTHDRGGRRPERAARARDRRRDRCSSAPRTSSARSSPGVAAALLGAVPAVVLGGVATIALAGVWRWLFPDLARIDRIDELRPEPAESPRPLCRVRARWRPSASPRSCAPRPAATGRSTSTARRCARCSRTSSRPTRRCASGIFDGDELPQFLNVFIDGTDVRLLDGLDTEVADGRDRDPAARRRGRRAGRPQPPRPATPAEIEPRRPRPLPATVAAVARPCAGTAACAPPEVAVRLGPVAARDRDVELGVAPHAVLGDVETGRLRPPRRCGCPKVIFITQRIANDSENVHDADDGDAERLHAELVEAAACRRGRRGPWRASSASAAP